uniref:Uncharacterized protein n=1 Tax=Sander lucioperca TaxID=283035 RepID=A0A8C9ZIX3_SANLU
MVFSLFCVIMNEQVSGSMSSIHPADFGDVEVHGSIQFAVNYIQKLGEFHIFVVHCRDLAMAETKKNYTDPWTWICQSGTSATLT